MSFGRELAAFRQKTMEKYVKVKRMSAFDLFSAIVLETPVDKGTLRNNWFADIGRGSTETTSASDTSGTGTISRINSILNGSDLTNELFLTNNLPYANRIEFDGYSGKAPAGMVRVNTARWETIVNLNVRRVNSGG